MTRITNEYNVPRYTLVRIAALEYVRAFWWWIIVLPVFGLVAAVTATGILQVVGIIALLWPLTIPSRAFLVSSRAGRILVDGVWIGEENERLYFHPTKGNGFSMSDVSIRDIVDRGDYLVLRTKRMAFFPIPKTAVIGPESLSRFRPE